MGECGKNKIYKDMKNDILTIEVAREDLASTPESWKKNSFEKELSKLQGVAEEKNGYPPFGNTKFIREISFKVLPSTTLEDIMGMIKEIENDYNFTCFQVSIYRHTSSAHMLFSWVNLETGKTIRFNNMSKFKMLAVFIARRLHLPYPHKMDEWVRYYIVDAYRENKNVFNNLLKSINEADLGFDKTLLLEGISYINYMCEGKVK